MSPVFILKIASYDSSTTSSDSLDLSYSLKSLMPAFSYYGKTVFLPSIPGAAPRALNACCMVLEE